MKRFLFTTAFALALLPVNATFSQGIAAEGVPEPGLEPVESDAGYKGKGYEEKGAVYPSFCAGCRKDQARCGCGPTWYAEFDTFSARYRRADGTTADFTDPNAAFDFGRQLSPRVTLGVVLNSGLGVRLRYFDYDHGDTNANGVTGSVKATVLDLELFENLRLTNSTALEWSVGVRGSEFTEAVDLHPLLGNDLFGTDFDGVGLVAGLEVNRMVRWGSVYARGRGALLVGDRDVMAPGVGYPELVQPDITPGMLEFAVGWEFSHVFHNGLILSSGVGWEVQQWMNYSIAAPTALPSTTPLDVGFDGAVFSFAVGY